jgi:hypothetical protein
MNLIKRSTSRFPPQFYPLLLLSIALALTPCGLIYAQTKINRSMPVSLIGVHHLGEDYTVYRFYINKSIGDNIGEGGGGGSLVCCIVLPEIWGPSLKVDVRWEVDHIIRSNNPRIPEQAELKGMYRAEVPIEKYSELGNLYVHFFPDGRVRAIVSSISSNGELHPVRPGDRNAVRKATIGREIKVLLTPDEISEIARDADRERKQYGDWR